MDNHVITSPHGGRRVRFFSSSSHLFIMTAVALGLSGCTAITKFEASAKPDTAPTPGLFKWLPDGNGNGRFNNFYKANCFYEAAQNDAEKAIPFSQCANVVSKEAIDVCVFETYHQDAINQFANMGLAGVLIASGAATGIAALLHVSGSTTTDVAAGTAAATTIVGITQKTVPSSSQPTISTMQQTASAYLNAFAPSYRTPSAPAPGPAGATWTCLDPVPSAAGGGSGSNASTPSCYVPWLVATAAPKGSEKAPDPAQAVPTLGAAPVGLAPQGTANDASDTPSPSEGAAASAPPPAPAAVDVQLNSWAWPTWQERDFARLYDAVLSACPQGTL